MKTEVVDEIKNTMFNQIINFENMLLDRKWENDERKRQLALHIIKMVDSFVKNDIDDYDLWVFLTYRQGKMRSKNSCIKKLHPKTLVNVLLEGLEIPDDTTMVEIEIKPVLKKNYDRKVSSESIYSITFGLGNGEELTNEQLKRRYGLTPKDNLYSVEDLRENGKILKFYNRKKRAKERIQERESVLSL